MKTRIINENELLINKNFRNNQNYIIWMSEKNRIINIKLLQENKDMLSIFLFFPLLIYFIFVFLFVFFLKFKFNIDLTNWTNNFLDFLFWTFLLIWFSFVAYFWNYYAYNNNFSYKKYFLLKKTNIKNINYDELVRATEKNLDFILNNYYIKKIDNYINNDYDNFDSTRTY